MCAYMRFKCASFYLCVCVFIDVNYCVFVHVSVHLHL